MGGTLEPTLEHNACVVLLDKEHPWCALQCLKDLTVPLTTQHRMVSSVAQNQPTPFLQHQPPSCLSIKQRIQLVLDMKFYFHMSTVVRINSFIRFNLCTLSKGADSVKAANISQVRSQSANKGHWSARVPPNLVHSFILLSILDHSC